MNTFSSVSPVIHSAVLFSDGMAFPPGHVGGVGFDSFLADLADAGGAVGVKEQSEHSRHEVVEIGTGERVLMRVAFSTGRPAVFAHADSDSAPTGFFVPGASPAFSFPPGVAGPAVQAPRFRTNVPIPK